MRVAKGLPAPPAELRITCVRTHPDGYHQARVTLNGGPTRDVDTSISHLGPWAFRPAYRASAADALRRGEQILEVAHAGISAALWTRARRA